MYTTGWETCFRFSHAPQLLYKPFLFFPKPPYCHAISLNQWPFHQLEKLGHLMHAHYQLLSPSAQTFFLSLPTPSSCPASLFLLSKAKLATSAHVDALWSNVTPNTYLPFDCIFNFISLKPNSLWPWNSQVSPDIITLQLDPASHRPPSCPRTPTPSSFISKDLKGVVCTHGCFFSTFHSFSTLCNLFRVHPPYT